VRNLASRINAPPAQPSQTEKSPAGGAVKTKRSFVGAAVLLWIVLGAVALGLGYLFYQEYYASRPDDPDRALEAARAWTDARYASDYDAMEELICNRYRADVREMQKGAAMVGMLADAMGVDMTPEKPRGIEYDLATINGPNAQVRVGGVFSSYGLGSTSSLDVIYAMRREGGDWKWCGQVVEQ
jgi:hypothetical protein